MIMNLQVDTRLLYYVIRSYYMIFWPQKSCCTVKAMLISKSSFPKSTQFYSITVVLPNPNAHTHANGISDTYHKGDILQ